MKFKKISFKNLLVDKNVSKISIIGVGMVTTPGVTYRMFQALAGKKINIQVISTSEIKISVLAIGSYDFQAKQILTEIATETGGRPYITN